MTKTKMKANRLVPVHIRLGLSQRGILVTGGSTPEKPQGLKTAASNLMQPRLGPLVHEGRDRRCWVSCGRRIHRLWGPNYLEKDLAPLEENQVRKVATGASLAVQWLRLCPSSAGSAALILGEGAKIPHASQPKKQKHNKWKPYC